MELEQIYDLMDRFDRSTSTVLELEQEGVRLRLEKGCTAPATMMVAAPVAPPAAPAPAPVAEPTGTLVKAPLVGTFYAAAGPDKPPFATVGSTVKKGETLCVLEAMKMMSEIPAPADCVVEAVLVEDGALVGFDAPLFRVREL